MDSESSRSGGGGGGGGGEAFAVRGDHQILLNTHKRQCGVSYQGSSRIQMSGLYGPLTVATEGVWGHF